MVLVFQDLKVTLELLEPLEALVLLEALEPQDQQDHLEQLVQLVQWVQQVVLEALVYLAKQEEQVSVQLLYSKNIYLTQTSTSHLSMEKSFEFKLFFKIIDEGLCEKHIMNV